MKQNIFLRKYCKLTLIIMLIAIQAVALQAQIRTRTAKDSSLAQLNHYWFNSTTDNNYGYQMPFPKLQVIPPLSTDMPYDILLSYLYLDSLMRMPNGRVLFTKQKKYWDSVNTKNDTLVHAIKYIYKLKDYDPVRFYQYSHSLGPLYTFGINGILGITEELLNSIINNTPNQAVMNDLCFADYILRVKVNSIDSMPWIKSPPEYYVYNVNAEVIDTLKGKVFESCSNQQYIEKSKKSNDILISNPNICFVYVTGPYQGVDKSLLDTNGLVHPYNLRLKPNQELIIFLSHGMYLWDYNYDYMDFDLFDVMPVINGQVKNNSYEWGSSLYMDYQDWKNAFFQKRDMLLNGGY